MLTVTYDDGGVTRALDLAIDSVSDLGPIFRIYLKWLRADVDKVFKNNNWAPLDPATLEHRQAHMEELAARIRSSAVEGVSSRLRRERVRAAKRFTRAAMRGVSADKLARSGRTLARHDTVRAEFERLREGRDGSLAKEAKRLPERLIRAGVRAENKIAALQSGELLGRVAQSMAGKIEKDSLEYFSRWKKAGSHNEGDRVGHGAELPKREFLTWTPERIAKLAQIAATYVANKIKR